MSFEDEFDKIIKQKAEEAGYEFDPANWEKASKMLNAERAAVATAGLKRLYLPALAVGIAGITVLAALYPVVNEPTAKQNIAASNTNSPSTLSAQPVRANNASDHTSVPVTAAASDSYNDIADAEKPSETPPVKPNEIASPDKVVSPRFKTETIYRIANAEAPTAKSENAVSARAVSEDAITNGNTNSDNASTNKASTANETGYVENTDIKSGNDPATVSKEGYKTSTARADVKSTEEPAQNQVFSGTAKPGLQVALMVEQLPLLMVNNFSQELALKPMNNNDYVDLHYRKHSVNIEAGALYNFGWQTPAGTDAKGFNWYAGVGYIYSPNRRIGFGSGLQVYNIANMSQPFHTASKTEYGFGSVNSGTVLTGQELYYLGVPVKVYYTPNSFNQFGLGITASYLYNSVSTSQTYMMMDGIKQYGTRQNIKGVYNGTSVYNFAINASYSLKVSKRVAVNSELVYTLTDVFANSGSVKNSEKPVGVRVGLHYILVEK